MRELLNLLDTFNLTESVGLARRKPGEKFENPQGDKIYFQSLDFVPEVGHFADAEELQEKVRQVTQQFKRPVEWTNQPAKNSLAFGIATFTDEAGEKYYLGRYFREIRANRNDNDFPHNAIPGGFKFNTKAGAKENAGYKPSQVLKSFERNSAVQVISQIVDKFGIDSDEAQAARLFLSSRDFPVTIPRGTMNFDAFRIYFCEMLQPVALVKGMTVGGNAQEAIDIFFGPGSTLKNCSINFNDAVGGALSDSILVNPDGKELKISTKDSVGGGAKASAQNLIKAIDELQLTLKGAKLVHKHREIMPVLEALRGNAHFSGPLKIAVHYNLLTKEEAQQVMNLKNLKLDLGEELVGRGIVSKRLEGWYSDYMAKWNKPVVPIHTLILIIAYRVTKYVNEHTGFGSAAADILNHSALIQVYNTVTQQGENFVIEGMTAHYPSNAVTGVTLTTEKSYWTTGAQGNMTFKIHYNGEKPRKEVPPEQEAGPAPKPKSDLVDPETNRLDVAKLGPGRDRERRADVPEKSRQRRS